MSLNISQIVPIISVQVSNSENIVIVSADNLLFFFNCLKKHISYRYQLLSYIAGVDLLGYKYRFSIIYDVLSLTYNVRLRIKVYLNEVEAISSLTSIYINANWWEREIWDLFGVYFENHPDLRKILTDYGFEGYPLRKDFPLYGYLDLRYDEVKKQIVVEPIELSQNFRSFVFETLW
jgi:NADH/F420H2 dehydrogenase subunit C